MYKFLNIFLNSDYFNNLPKFVARKLFKIFKIFFVETNLQSLPINNHPTTINKIDISALTKNNADKFFKPFSTCSYSLEILALYASINKGLKVLDFGANNLDNYTYLNRYLNNWNYIYHDLPDYNKYISNLIKEENLKNINVVNNLSEINHQLDFVFFGSSIHYINEYKTILMKIFQNKSKYVVFSHTPFYISKKNDKDIVVKQINIHPTINYAYFLEYNNFISFMNKNNYELISQNKNNFIKFLNFKNFKNFEFINFLDLIFINKNA